MKYSKCFPKTVHGEVKQADLISNQLLVKAGFIKESTAGRYFFLPLGWRVHEKIKQVIKEEMDKAGAQEMMSPVLHPLELWQETNRTSTAGFELMRVKDRREAQFALGGTAEEMFVDIVRKYQLSYKDLPINLYQFSTKFRDELRARGGLLRVREFVMKDAYSFHATQADFEREYELMGQVYRRIFERLGLKTIKAEAGNGYIGGEYSHEFQAPCENGEDTIFELPSGKAFNQEMAPAKAPAVKYTEEAAGRQDVLGVGIIGVQELADFLKIPVEKTTKTLIFEADKGRIIAAAVRGGYEINEAKLKKAAKTDTLKLASEEKVKQVTRAEVGYAGLLNLPAVVEIFVDESCSNRMNMEMGANKTDFHSINVNWGRDLPLPAEFYDIKKAKVGDLNPGTNEPYHVVRSIEVGNIFQLGYHYTHLMRGADFIDRDGKRKPYYMGCYGIGLGRTMAALVEKYHDEKGMVWPKAVAPFQAHLITLGNNPSATLRTGDQVYNQLIEAGVEVLWDERDESPGKKFADADLIGIPVRLVVSERTLRQGSGQAQDMVEWKERTKKETELLSIDEVIDRLK